MQRQAVQHAEGPLLLLSGAGSGKTRVITYRIAYLLGNRHVEPSNILAVTFSNKAAGMMKSRLEDLIGEDTTKSIRLATFHATCVRILRRNINRLGYSRSFTIYDAYDQVVLIKEILKELQMREELNNPKAVLRQISKAKNNFETPENLMRVADSYFEEHVGQIYSVYQIRLREYNSLDFDDLIGLTVELFHSCPDVLRYYQNQFRYILVDEYQDTNRGQYLLVHALAKEHQNICAVGDDDQSIYSWRGADINNILDFEKDYPKTTVLRLEQNYRSTQNILSAAYEVVRNNRRRKEKKLWTENGQGDLIDCYEAIDEVDEAKHVIKQIREARSQGLNYADCVIFYRINAQSRAFEEALREANIPYQIVGGVRFYDRMEIKDLIAYLRVIANPDDSISLKRIINVPRRGIGNRTLGKLEDFAVHERISLYTALKRVNEVSTLREATRVKIRGFLQLIEIFNPARLPVESIHELLDVTGYLTFLKSDNTIEAMGRVENVSEFISAAARYEGYVAAPTLSGFLELITLVADVDDMDDKSDVVTLMTLHSAKGLEFPIVFMAGVEEGSLPHQRAFANEAELEEERRLCYVGLTRAKERASLSHARTRRIHGVEDYRMPSRFIGEIPPDLINHVDRYETAHRPTVRSYDPDEPDYDVGPSFDHSVGEFVFHPKFGRGKITGISGSGGNMRITIRFARGGEKTLLAEYAPLQPMEM
ncbi:MAG: UvrD-helicase domain-containing protein [Candidatus Poribacteria bacterium]|nr:UvrD-helicase domain-containing protein [Candidatus Poribacteria bacterium]